MNQRSTKMSEKVFEGEKPFLRHNREVLQTIKAMQRTIQSHTNSSSLDYAEAICAYGQYIDFISKLVKEICISNNSIGYSEIIAELINRGYLSHNGKFVFEGNPSVDIVGYDGVSVISGYGCCRHTSSIHRDIFNKIGEDSDCLYCNRYDEEISISEAFSDMGNHVVNLIRYKGVYYLYDTLNRELLTIVKAFIAMPHSIYQNINPRIYYRPSSNMILNNKSYSEAISMILKFWYNSKKEQIGVGELYDIVTETRSIFDKESSVLKDFKDESKIYTGKIISLINKKK